MFFSTDQRELKNKPQTIEKFSIQNRRTLLSTMITLFVNDIVIQPVVC